MKKRIFTALDISDRARAEAGKYIKNLRERFPGAQAGWDKPEKLHLTLKFLGEIESETLQRLQQAAEKAARETASFKLRISGTGVFPSAKKARVLWLGVNGEVENLQKLNRILENECEIQGLAREQRAFKAHLTIARLKEKSSELVEAHLLEAFAPIEFKVSELVIYQSELRPTGSIYSVVSRHDFKK